MGVSPVQSPLQSPRRNGSPWGFRETDVGRPDSPTEHIMFAISEHFPLPFRDEPDGDEVVAMPVLGGHSFPVPSPLPLRTPSPRHSPPPPPSSSIPELGGEATPISIWNSRWSAAPGGISQRQDNLITSVSETLAGVMQEMDTLIEAEEEIERQVSDSSLDVTTNLTLDEILSRVRRRPRTPHMIVRLPTGGYSYAPSRLYSPLNGQRRRLRRPRRERPNLSPLASPHQRRRAMQDRPILMQASSPNRQGGRSRQSALSWSRISQRLARGRPDPIEVPERVGRTLVPILLTEAVCPPGRCAICLANFADGIGTKYIAYVDCQSTTSLDSTKDHCFCLDCIEGWIAHSGTRTCPTCRGVF